MFPLLRTVEEVLLAYLAYFFTSRKTSLTVILSLGGLSCLAVGFIPVGHVVESIAAYMVGIFAFDALVLQLWLVTAEVYPTNLRYSFCRFLAPFSME